MKMVEESVSASIGSSLQNVGVDGRISTKTIVPIRLIKNMYRWQQVRDFPSGKSDGWQGVAVLNCQGRQSCSAGLLGRAHVRLLGEIPEQGC